MQAPREIIGSLLGYYLDGWADLIEGFGSRANMVQKETIKQLEDRHLPEIKIEKANIKAGIFSDGRREYTITTTAPGATTTIYIAEHGTDLYASWRTYIRAPINWSLLLNIFFICISLASMGFSIWILYDIYIFIKNFTITYYWGNFLDAFLKYAEYLIFFLIIGEIFFAVVSRVKTGTFHDYLDRKRVLAAFLVYMLLALAVDDIANNMISGFSIIIKSSEMVLQRFADSLRFSLIALIDVYFGILILLAVAGFILKKDVLAFLTIKPNLFDVEDITAMSLAVHKCLLRALDLAGIQSSQLRMKQNFKVGRRGESI